MICPKCQINNNIGARYCKNCGSKLIGHQADEFNSHLIKVILYFLGLLLFVVCANILGNFNGNAYIILLDVILAIITISLVIINYKEMVDLLLPDDINLKVLCFLLLGLILLAIGVNWIIDKLHISLDYYKSPYFISFRDINYPLLNTIIFYAVYPAITEEILFRGLIFNGLKKIVSLHSTILVSSFMFAILHLSFISFIWIFSTGCLFGYLRLKYNTLFYGIVGHFVFNSTVILIEYIEYMYMN